MDLSVLIYDVCDALCTQRKRMGKELKNAFKHRFNILMHYLNLKGTLSSKKKEKKDKECVSVNYMEVGNAFELV